MSTINKPFRKKDAMQLVTGQPVYMDDVIPQDCLIVKLLRSPHANAIVKTINTAVAKKVPGIEAIFTWEDVPQDAPRYTQAGQTYPEASPRDRLLIDRHVRFVGDVVAIVAGKDEKCVDKALKLIKVEYEVLEAVLDYHTAKDNPILVHPEDNWASLCPVGADNKRNLCAHDECEAGQPLHGVRLLLVRLSRAPAAGADQQARQGEARRLAQAAERKDRRKEGGRAEMKLVISASPHIDSGATTRKIMGDVLIALLPALIAAGARNETTVELAKTRRG